MLTASCRKNRASPSQPPPTLVADSLDDLRLKLKEKIESLESELDDIKRDGDPRERITDLEKQVANLRDASARMKETIADLTMTADESKRVSSIVQVTPANTMRTSVKSSPCFRTLARRVDSSTRLAELECGIRRFPRQRRWAVESVLPLRGAGP